MMRSIYKYPLDGKDAQRIRMPLDAEFLTVQVQNDQPCLWALVNNSEDAAEQDVTVRIFGTGHMVSGITGDYVGTVQLGPLVFHVFVEPQRPE